jgi:dihydrofolate synthase/folylpolyglutamate synthase
MTHNEAIEFLFSLRVFGAKLGLENTRKLAELAGNPHGKLRFIHVAGTNGKGSTCAMLESIYRAAGLKVGLFTSPHLVSFAERIQVNRVPASEADIVRLVWEMQPLLAKFPSETHPTFFEVVTVMALRYFAEQQCDLVIWETGLGGRLDATNIVTPLASVITNIGLDHQQWLGDTHDAIAAEKAGIIKPGVQVVTAAKLGEGLETIRAVAASLASPLTVVTANNAERALPAETRLALLGKHQLTNAAVAVATVRALRTRVPVSDESVAEGLRSVRWAGRMQMIEVEHGRRILLDGAHNLDGAAALVSALREEFPEERPAMILGLLADKDWRSVADLLAPCAARILLVPVSSSRGLKPDELLPVCVAANPGAAIKVFGSLGEALGSLREETFVLVTGSLYLIGETLAALGQSATSELALNDYTTKART